MSQLFIIAFDCLLDIIYHMRFLQNRHIRHPSQIQWLNFEIYLLSSYGLHDTIYKSYFCRNQLLSVNDGRQTRQLKGLGNERTSISTRCTKTKFSEQRLICSRGTRNRE